METTEQNKSTRVKQPVRDIMTLVLAIDKTSNELIDVTGPDGSPLLTGYSKDEEIDWSKVEWNHPDIMISVIEPPKGAQPRSHCPPGYSHVTINGKPACKKDT